MRFYGWTFAKMPVLRNMAAASALLASLSCFSQSGCMEPENMARGRPYVLSAKPNYGLCTDAGDAVQLTDGEWLKPGADGFWTKKSVVGWQIGGVGDRMVTVDLGADEPICGFAWNYAAGFANVGWPTSMLVYVSPDGKAWRFVGDLLAKHEAENGEPPKRGFSIRRARSLDMPCRGRYVAFLVRSTNFMFVDEVEVYRGDPEVVAARWSGGAEYPSPLAHFAAKCDVDDFVRRAEIVAAAALDIPEADRRAVMLAMGRVQARVMRSLGYSAPFMWEGDRWASASESDMPRSQAVVGAAAVVTMMRGETRSASVNLSNPTGNELDVEVAAEGFPSDANVELREVVPTRVKSGAKVGGLIAGEGRPGLRLKVPPGSTRQIWVSFSKPSATPGRHAGRIVAGGVSIPVVLDLAPVDFPARPRLHVGGWDYTDVPGFYRNPSNLTARIARMREMFVDSPWAGISVMPRGAKFDADGRLVNPGSLDFSAWRRWTALWGEQARQYCVFMAVRNAFHGEKAGTERFRKMVGGYMRAWHDGVKDGLGGRRVVVLLVDEPDKPEMFDTIVAWSNAIKSGAPSFAVFEEADPRKVADVVFDAVDIFCPGAPNVTARWAGALDKKDEAPDREDRDVSKKELWLYSCCGPSRMLDPVAYYRSQAWLAWKTGAKATQFWAFGCGGGIGDSFRPLEQTSTEYSPFFVSSSDAFRAKQSEAVMESVEDYEYLAMLADRIAALRAEGRDVSAAEALLGGAADRALPREPWLRHNKYNFFKASERYGWLNGNHDHAAMDAVRVAVLKALVALRHHK